ncbi:MAG: sulfotransferase domain-containing protein, partial [Deltaproteobacteria bacterium]|nr:sulfotransferase domain-containing protein [Deltaproteobacteria bacterium]
MKHLSPARYVSGGPGAAVQIPDRYTPVRFAHRVAKRLGLSRRIVEVANASLRSERSMRAAFAGYTPTERDVVVATFVKSGTNWAMQICQQIAHRGAAEFEHIHDLVPWPDNMDGRPIGLDDPVSWRDSPTGLRVIKTHLAEVYVPRSDAARYVVVLRDPKEVVVSSYYFLAPLLGVADTLDPADWLDVFVARRVGGVEAWVDHALGWWGLRDAPEVLVLFFADMKRDLAGAVDRIAAHLGVALNSEERAAVIERSGLAWMKANNDKFAPVPMPFALPTHMPDMVRRGVSGGSAELYTPEQLAPVDAR